MSYHKALTIDPSYIEAWSNMSILLKSLDKEKEDHQPVDTESFIVIYKHMLALY
jgi:hypothetical protein